MTTDAGWQDGGETPEQGRNMFWLYLHRGAGDGGVLAAGFVHDNRVDARLAADFDEIGRHAEFLEHAFHLFADGAGRQTHPDARLPTPMRPRIQAASVGLPPML